MLYTNKRKEPGSNRTGPTPSTAQARTAGSPRSSNSEFSTPADILQLQKLVGNQAAIDFLATQQHNSFPLQPKLIQRQGEENGEEVKIEEEDEADLSTIVSYSYDEDHPRKANIDGMVSQIDQAVQEAKEAALQWGTYEQADDGGHLKKWYRSASRFVQSGGLDLPKTIYADYGYAIETIACSNIQGSHGLNVSFQVSVGHTRPDIVLSDENGEVAWIDITSDKSVGHIKLKSGSGWRIRPFVFEISYESLDVSTLLDTAGDEFYKEYGEFNLEEHQIELQAQMEQLPELRSKFESFYDKKNLAGINNESIRKRLTQQFFTKEMLSDNTYRETHMITKGALVHLNLNPLAYGYQPRDKQTNKGIKELIATRAKPISDLRKQALAASKIIEIHDYFFENAYYSLIPTANLFFTGIFNKVMSSEDISSEDIKAALMLKHAGSEYRLLLDIDEMNFEAEKAEDLMNSFPQELDVVALREWRNEARAYIQEYSAPTDIQEEWIGVEEDHNQMSDR